VGRPAAAKPSKASALPRETLVPLQRGHRSFFVESTINGHLPVRLLLDTGAAYVTIHEKLAHKLRLDLSQAEPVDCILADGSQSSAHRTRVDRVRLGDAVLHDVDVLIMPTPPSPSHDGLLGMSFLENYVFEIDAQAASLWLRSKSKASTALGSPAS